jgi:uncharacterized integral membrane protein
MAGSGGRSDQGGSRRQLSTRDIVRIVVAVIGIAILISFIVDNSQTVRVGFVFFHSNVSLIWALLIAAFLGALIDRLAVILRQRRRGGSSDN